MAENKERVAMTHSKSRPHLALSSEENASHALCAATLDAETEGKHFFVIEALSGKTHLIRVLPTGISMIPSPETSSLKDIDDIDAMLEKADIMRFADCTKHEYDEERKKLTCQFNTGKQIVLHSVRGEELESIVVRNLGAVQEHAARMAMLSRPSQQHLAMTAKSSFQDLCLQLDEYVHSHHMTDRVQVPPFTINEILAANANQEIAKAKKDNNEVFGLAIALGIFLTPIVGLAFGSSGVAWHDSQADKKIRKMIKKEFVHAKKGEYLYFKSGKHDDNAVYYYHNLHFGVVKNAIQK